MKLTNCWLSVIESSRGNEFDDCLIFCLIFPPCLPRFLFLSFGWCRCHRCLCCRLSLFLPNRIECNRDVILISPNIHRQRYIYQTSHKSREDIPYWKWCHVLHTKYTWRVEKLPRWSNITELFFFRAAFSIPPFLFSPLLSSLSSFFLIYFLFFFEERRRGDLLMISSIDKSVRHSPPPFQTLDFRSRNFCSVELKMNVNTLNNLCNSPSIVPNIKECSG